MKLKLKEKVDELEKAAHTATSDPTSKKDITVAGDMEIDSDTESQEDSSSQPSVPDQFQLPPSTQFPQPTFHRNNFPFAIPSPLTIPLNSPLRPLLPTGPAYTTLQHAIPYSPSMPKPQGHFIRTLLPSGINPTIVRLSSPISLTTINNANIGSIENMPTHSTPNLENIEAVIIPESTPTVKITSVPSISAPLPTSVSLPIIYSSSTASGNETVVPIQRDMSSSLEDRLKGLVNQKALPESLFQDYSDSDSEDEKEEGGKPYSPSAIHSVTVDFSNSKDNEDKESLPTPNMSPVTPEYLKSPLEYASSNVTKSTSVPFPAYTVHNYTATANNELINTAMNAPSVNYTRSSYNEEDNQREMNRGGDKGNIRGGLAALLNSITQSKDSINTMTVQSSADTAVTSTTDKSFDPENIKITPSLTNLLDKIFPKLSQSLQSERKRKLDETSETHSDSTKVAKNETVNNSNMKDITQNTNEDIPSVATPTGSNFEPNSQLVSEFTRDIEKISNQVPHPPLKPFPIPEPPGGFTHPQMRPSMPHFELRSVPPPMPFPPRPHFNNQQQPNFGPPRGDFSLPQRFPPMNNIPPPPFPHGPPRFFRHQFPPPTLRPRYY